MPLRPLPALACLALVMTADACGGGSSSSGLSLQTTEVTFSAVAGAAAPPPKVVEGSITGVDSTVYLFVLYTNRGLAGASVEVTGPTSGRLILYPRPASQLVAGTYRDTATVRACLDPACRSEVLGSPRVVNVRYDVLGLAVSPGQLDLVAIEGDASAPATLDVSNLTGTPAWTTSVTYHQLPEGWLLVTPGSGSSTAQSLSVRGAAMPAGRYTATLSVKAGAVTRDIPVTYVVQGSLGVSRSLVELGAVAGQAASPAGGEVAVSSPRGAITYTTSVAYGVLGGGLATGWLDVTGGAAPGTLSLVPNTAALAPDVYTARVTLTPTSPGSAVDVYVRYTVAASELTFTPPSVAFTIDTTSPADAAHLERTVVTGDTGSPLTWAATTGVSWLAVTPAGASGDPATLSLLPGQVSLLPEGSTTAQVVFSTVGSLSPPATSTLQVTLDLHLPSGAFATSPAAAALHGASGQPTLPTGVAVTVTPLGTATAYTTSVAYGPGAAGWLQATGTTAPGTLSIDPTSTVLAPGTYQATVRLTPVGLGRSVDVPVNYTLAPSAFLLAAPAVAFAVDATTPADAAHLQRTLLTGATGSPLAWTARASVPWLVVTPSGNTGDPVTVALVPAALGQVPAGDFTATVTFTASGPTSPPITTTLAVTLRLDLPTLDFVAPYVGYLDEQQEVIVRGAGFSRGGAAPLLVGGEAPASLVIVSDTEVRLVPPKFAAPGREAILVANVLGVPRRTVDLVVRDHPNHAYAALSTTDLDVQNEHLIYDAERDAVLTARAFFQGTAGAGGPTSVTRFARDPGTGAWSKVTASFSALFDIALSPDGRVLLVLTSNQLLLVDPVTLVVQQGVSLPAGSVTGSSLQLAALNDGTVIVQSLQQGYSLVTGTFRSLAIGWNLLAVDASADGSRAVMGAAVNDGSVPFTYYDASSGTVITTAVRQYYSPGTLSRTASKLLSGSTLWDGGFTALGTLPYRSFLMPDGNRAFAAGTGAVRVFDLTSAGPAFTELSQVPVPDDPGFSSGRVRMAASLDSRTLFLVGPARFVVLPVP